jgi:hypothetical protein
MSLRTRDPGASSSTRSQRWAQSSTIPRLSSSPGRNPAASQQRPARRHGAPLDRHIHVSGDDLVGGTAKLQVYLKLSLELTRLDGEGDEAPGHGAGQGLRHADKVEEPADGPMAVAVIGDRAEMPPLESPCASMVQSGSGKLLGTGITMSRKFDLSQERALRHRWAADCGGRRTDLRQKMRSEP